jgi:hypothetical protein
MARKGFNRRKVSQRLAMTALATAAATGIGLSTSAAANAAAGPSWVPVSPSAVSGAVTATASVHFGGNKTAEWAFVTTSFETNGKGYPSVYSRVNSGSWAKTALPGSGAGEVFVSATAINNTSLLAFSNLANGTGREWQFNGSAWKVIKTFSAPIGNASVTSPADVWVAGTVGGTDQLGVYHYNGATWTKLASTLHGVQGLSGSSAWAYTGSTVASYNGATWKGTNLASLIGGSAPRITDVYSVNGTLYAVADNGGTTVILDFNAKGWAKVGQAASTDPLSNEISSDGDGGIWFLAAKHGEASEAVHYTSSVKTVTVSGLPGKVMAITRVNNTNELAGGFMASGKANPAEYAELEYYN